MKKVIFMEGFGAGLQREYASLFLKGEVVVRSEEYRIQRLVHVIQQGQNPRLSVSVFSY